LYEGWKIYAYHRKISKTEELIIRNKLKTWFNSGDWYFSEDDYGITIFYGVDRQKINVSFQEVKYGSEKDGSVDTYQMVFSSILFGHKTFQERTHQGLCKKILQKIPWKKRGFWLADNIQTPIPTIKILRMKR